MCHTRNLRACLAFAEIRDNKGDNVHIASSKTNRRGLTLAALVALAAPLVMGAAALTTATLSDDADDRKHPDFHARLDSQVATLLSPPVSQDGQPQPITQAFDPETGTVLVAITAEANEAPTLEADLLADGASRVVALEGIVLADVSLTTLEELAQDSRVAGLALPPRPVFSAVGEGVAAIDADHWHDAKGTGAGVKVAIIDGGFAGNSALLGTELPSSVTKKDFCSTTMGTPEVHGTAVAEILHEVAPKVDMYLICIDDVIDLIDAVDYSIDQDIDIISHSMGWLGGDTAGDGTGLIGAIADWAHDSGILWVNSAGNHAEAHWGGQFDDTGTVDGWHEFATSDRSIQFSLQPDQVVSVYLRWADGVVVDNDFDLYLFAGGSPSFNPADDAFASQGVQDGSESSFPYEEFVLWNNTASATTIHVAIYEFDAAETPEMDIFIFGLDPSTQMPIDHAVAARSLLDPATAENVLSVGANFVGGSVLESFSSQGPTLDGRIKPDITAPDGVSSTTYGSFYGTSASAPHVAGAAALLLGSTWGKNLTPTELKALLTSEYVDPIEVESTVPNNEYGYGILEMGNPAIFPDVYVTNPFIDDIHWLAETGVTGGYDDGTFRPGVKVARQAMAAFLYRFAGSPEFTAPAEPSFPDVPLTHPFYNEIEWLADSGITGGFEDGKFYPGATVSRQAMSAFLYRFAGEPDYTPPGSPTFPDVPLTHPFFAEIEWLADTGITGGFSDGEFKGGEGVGRQAMAAFLRRYSDEFFVI
jgi:subtilisin family serine protease